MMISNCISGQYECRINQVNTQDISTVISTLDTYIQLRAVVQHQENQPEVSSGIISLPFLPAFYVHTSEVHLSNLLPLTSVRISAVDKVIQDLKVQFFLKYYDFLKIGVKLVKGFDEMLISEATTWLLPSQINVGYDDNFSQNVYSTDLVRSREFNFMSFHYSARKCKLFGAFASNNNWMTAFLVKIIFSSI